MASALPNPTQPPAVTARGARLLIVEHDRKVAESLKDLLTKLGYEVPFVSSTAEEAIAHAAEMLPDLVLMGLPDGLDGVETSARLNADRHVPVVYMSPHAEEDAFLERARASKPYGYLQAPYSERGMHATIQMALGRRQAESDLEKSEQRLRESERRFASMLHNVQLISVMLDRDGLVTYCNEYLARLSGWPVEEIVGRNWFKEFVPSGEEGAKLTFDGLLNDLPAAWHYEGEIRLKAGGTRLVHWNNSVLRGPDGEVIGIASLGEDITERSGAEKEIRQLNADLETRVIERTMELEAANRDLEAYDQSVAHDLRAPARSIAGFGQLLLDECASQLDETARDYVTRMVASSVKMNELVTDLFALSTVGHAPLKRSAVNLGAIARAAFQAIADPARKVQLIVPPGLVTEADAGLMMVLLQHLVGNACKFTARRAEAVIEIGTLKQGDDVPVFFVRDNGAGFDVAEAEHLFEPFGRAHTQADFAGTGLGLPTVRRIVARHGGRVWGEGKTDVGATFYFTLEPAPAGQTPT